MIFKRKQFKEYTPEIEKSVLLNKCSDKKPELFILDKIYGVFFYLHLMLV